MRVDVVPIIEQAVRLAAAIADKSKSRAAQEAHTLLTVMPSPCWAETAPGCTIYFNDEQGLAQKIEQLRYSVLTWLRALVDPRTDWEPSATWPEPVNLLDATRELAAYASECVNLKEDGPVAVEV